MIKFIEVQSEDQRLNLELGAKFFRDGKIQESLECYLTAAQIIMNVYINTLFLVIRYGASWFGCLLL